MAVATVSDVEISLGRPITDDAQIDQVNQWLEDAELLIRSRLGDVSQLDQDVVAYVEREAVISKMRNPEGYQSETIDDYTYRHGENRGRVAIIDEWWDMLTPDSASAAFSITPFSEPGYRTDVSDSWA